MSSCGRPAAGRPTWETFRRRAAPPTGSRPWATSGTLTRTATCTWPTGGATVFPPEVESALIDHPKIADIVVIALKDPEWGRRVHAIIEPADPQSPPTAQEVREYAKSRLAAYKVPKTVEIVDAIPRSE